jgi:hypothetical protein
MRDVPSGLVHAVSGPPAPCDGQLRPLKTVLEQLDILGAEVVPVLRKEFDTLRPAHVPQAPTHASLKASRDPDATAGIGAEGTAGITVEAGR